MTSIGGGGVSCFNRSACRVDQVKPKKGHMRVIEGGVALAKELVAERVATAHAREDNKQMKFVHPLRESRVMRSILSRASSEGAM